MRRMAATVLAVSIPFIHHGCVAELTVARTEPGLPTRRPCETSQIFSDDTLILR